MTTQSERLEDAMRTSFGELHEVYTSPAFRAVLDELWALPPGSHRQRFVRDVLLDPKTREARGIVLPSSVELQRTYFDDDRPTLFALVAHLPSGVTWEKVTITVDDVASMAPAIEEPVKPQ